MHRLIRILAANLLQESCQLLGFVGVPGNQILCFGRVLAEIKQLGAPIVIAGLAHCRGDVLPVVLANGETAGEVVKYDGPVGCLFE